MDFHEILEQFIPNLAAIVELIGVLIIIYGVVRSVILFVKSGGNLMATDAKIDLAKALAYSLEFKLAGEILKSVIVRTLDEFIVLAGVVVLRVVLTYVIHWELESSERSSQLFRMDEQRNAKKKKEDE